MSFFIVEVDNAGFKVYNTSGALIDPATEPTLASLLTTLASIKNTDGIKKITDPLPAGTNILGKIGIDSLETGGLALEATLGTRATEATLASIKDTDGVKKITDALPIGDNRIGRLKLTDDTNILLIPAAGDSLASGKGVAVLGKTNADLARFLLVDDQGRLSATVQPPTAPPGTTAYTFAVNEAELDVGSGGDVSSPHTSLGAVIGNTVNLYLQQITVGTEGDSSENGSVAEVYWREGAGPTDHLISRLYVAGESVTVQLPNTNMARDGTQMTGNGTNTRLIVVRRRLSTAALEIDFVVRGFTE